MKQIVIPKELVVTTIKKGKITSLTLSGDLGSIRLSLHYNLILL